MVKNLKSLNFNPRSREGSDTAADDEVFGYQISIHAPAKGATVAPAEILAPLRISIHAPAKGATADFYIYIYNLLCNIHY